MRRDRPSKQLSCRAFQLSSSLSHLPCTSLSLCTCPTSSSPSFPCTSHLPRNPLVPLPLAPALHPRFSPFSPPFPFPLFPPSPGLHQPLHQLHHRQGCSQGARISSNINQRLCTWVHVCGGGKARVPEG